MMYRPLAALLMASQISCATGSGGESQPDYLPLVEAALAGSQAVTDVGLDLAVSRGDTAGCYTAAALSTALSTGLSVVRDLDSGRDAIPGVSVDISACIALSGETPAPILSGEAQALVSGVSSAVLPAVAAITAGVLAASGASCETRRAIRAVSEYIQSAIPEVVSELSEPDGVITIPGRVFGPGCPTE